MQKDKRKWMRPDKFPAVADVYVAINKARLEIASHSIAYCKQFLWKEMEDMPEPHNHYWQKKL